MFGGLFGGDKPDGTVSDAWRLLQTGKIGPGRELLRRLIKHEPSNFEALVLGLYEMTRPPLIQGEARRRAELLETLAPDCNEGRSVFVCATWTNPSELTYASYDKMSKSSPRCAHGSAFRLIATIAMCDTEIQQTLRPDRQVSHAYVNLALKGCANLELRNYSVAHDCFSRGAKEAAAIPDIYAKHINDEGVELAREGGTLGLLVVREEFSIPPELKSHLIERYRLVCETGIALTLRDQGRRDEAKALFGRLSTQDSPLAEDLKRLAEES